jgi:hypothetical protein
MPDTPTPWVGLAALAALFLLPLLPDWLFEGPRTSKHWRRRHSCGDCGAPWTDEHSCTSRESKAGPADFPRLFTALGLQSTQEVRRGFAPWCAFSAFGRVRPIGIAAPLGRSCEVVSGAGGAARALPGHQGEAS